MANNSVSSIKANLTTQLGEVTELQDVETGRSFDFSGFPACRFYLQSVENNLISNAPMYKRRYVFAIDIIQETTNKTKADAEADLENAVDAVMDKLGTEWQLDSNVDNSRLESGTIAEIETPHGPAIVVSITFTTETFIS